MVQASATQFQVTGVRLSYGGTHHSHITHLRLGSNTELSTVNQILTWMSQGYRFYVTDRFGNTAYLQRVTHFPADYVKTVPDYTGTDNLLALPRL